MARDGYRVLCEYLDPEEAGMARGLLDSEGVAALVEDVHLSAVDPLVRLAISGAKVLVPEADVERARAVLAAGGVGLRGAPAEGAGEIPEEEWSRLPEAPEPAAPARPAPWLRTLLGLAAGGAALWLLLRSCAGS